MNSLKEILVIYYDSGVGQSIIIFIGVLILQLKILMFKFGGGLKYMPFFHGVLYSSPTCFVIK